MEGRVKNLSDHPMRKLNEKSSSHIERTSHFTMHFDLKTISVDDKELSPPQLIEMFVFLTEFAKKHCYYRSVVERLTKRVVYDQATAIDLEDLSFSTKDLADVTSDWISWCEVQDKEAKRDLVPADKHLGALPSSPFSGEIVPGLSPNIEFSSSSVTVQSNNLSEMTAQARYVTDRSRFAAGKFAKSYGF